MSTNLPNIYSFNDVLQQWITEGKEGFIAILQPGEYSNIVDLYGRDAGNEILSQMVQRLHMLSYNTHSKTTEFIAKFTNSAITSLDMNSIRIQQLTATPYRIKDRDVYITIKAGVGYFDPSSPVEQCIRHADLALTKARQRVAQT